MNNLSREQLLDFIWQEKREKIVSERVYPLGISITLEDLDFNWHTIIYGILDLLRKNVAQAFEWSKNWGRTTVWVHPCKSLSFRFTEDESQEEKLGVFISTEKVVDPSDFFNPEHNVGYFRIILNQNIMTLEGAILQVERMVDELVWCNFLRLKNQGQFNQTGLINETEIYAKAIEEVWEKGVAIEYMAEDKILDMKRRDMSLPVRIYGDVLGSMKVPRVVGAVIIPDSTGATINSIKLKHLRNHLVSSILANKTKQIVLSGSTAQELISRDSFVCVGITLTKEIHAGHLLLLGFAELVRRSLNISQPLYLESNNFGERIFGLVAKLAENFGISVSSVISLLEEGKVADSDICLCYRLRSINKGELFNEARERLKHCEIDLFYSLHQQAVRDLNGYGFSNLVLIPDSLCLKKYNELAESISGKWCHLGFRFVKYRCKKRNNLIVFERRGVPSAAAMRASFISEIYSRLKIGNPPVFIDADPSITQAGYLLRLAGKDGLTQVEGAGIGFNMQIASGTAGNIISAHSLFEAFRQKYPKEEKSFLSTVIFFLLNRYATVRSHKKHALGLPHPSVISFYDYKNNETFLSDFFLCFEEMALFNRALNGVVDIINSRMSKTQKGIGAGQFQEKFKQLLIKLQRVESEVERIFPRSKLVILERNFSLFRDWIHQKYKNYNSEEVDRVIVEAIISGCNTIGALSEFLSCKGFISHSPPFNRDERICCLFVDNLKLRGYSEQEVANYAVRYLQGEFCLVKKRCIFFEHLKTLIRVAENIVWIDNQNAEFLLRVISLYRERLGF